MNPDNTFEVSIDYKVVNHGSLLDDFSPPVNPPAEIDDPNDKKPADWDEREKIPGKSRSLTQCESLRKITRSQNLSAQSR